MDTRFHGRKRYYIGGQDEKEMWSHRIQGSAADMQNNAIEVFSRQYPHREGLGLLINGHDQMVAECLEDEADAVSAVMRASMETVVGKMRFPAGPKKGKSWKAVS